MKHLTDLKKARDRRERLAIAKDAHPRTRFDNLFEGVKAARFFVTTLYLANERRVQLERIGNWLADVIEARDSQTLHDLADATNKWKRHKPEPDRVLESLVALHGMFPESKIAVRDVVRSLRHKGVETDETMLRRIRRVAKGLGYSLDDTPGRPRKTGQTQR